MIQSRKSSRPIYIIIFTYRIHNLENYTIPVGIAKYSDETQWNVDLHSITYPFLLILETKNLSIPGLLKHSKSFQALLCGIDWTLTIFGSYFKYILYEYIFDQYKKKEVHPIDILTLVLALSHHIAVITQTIWVTLIIAMDESLDYWMNGSFFFIICRVVIAFDLAYSIIGSLGISIYRILYIKMDLWVKYGIGEKRLLYTVLAFGLALAFVPVIIQVPLGVASFVKQGYGGISWQMLYMLHDYDQSRGQNSIHSNWKNTNHVNILCISLMLVFSSSFDEDPPLLNEDSSVRKK